MRPKTRSTAFSSNERGPRAAYWLTSEFGSGELPISEQLCERYIQMPVGDLVSEEDILQLSEFLLFLCENAQKIEYGMRAKRAHG